MGVILQVFPDLSGRVLDLDCKVTPPVGGQTVVFLERVVGGHEVAERALRRKSCFLQQFTARRSLDFFIRFDGAARDLQGDVGEVRLIEDQEAVSPGRIDEHFARVRHFLSPLPPCHEGQAFEEVNILLVLQ